MQTGHMFLERRVESRIPIKISVKYVILEDENEIKNMLEQGKKDHNAHTMDLSLKGMSIVTQHSLIKGNILRIDVSLSGHPAPIRIFAQVMWANESGGGLKFLSLQDGDTEFLRAFLEKQAS